jgi:hypothetical protein
MEAARVADREGDSDIESEPSGGLRLTCVFQMRWRRWRPGKLSLSLSEGLISLYMTVLADVLVTMDQTGKTYRNNAGNSVPVLTDILVLKAIGGALVQDVIQTK